MNGTSATSIRRSTPGPRHSPMSWRWPKRATETRNGSRATSRSCCSISPGGSTARIAPGGTSSKAASSGSTTSASSIAAPACRPAAIWSRPTAPPGWPCSARTCSKSPWSWRKPTRIMPTWRSSSSSTSCGSPRRWLTWAATPACGTRKTASSTTCCACRTVRPNGSRCGRWSGSCPCARLRPSTGKY